MKKTEAFIETENDKTALVVLDRGKLGTYWCVKITHAGGACRRQPVIHHMTFADAMDDAKTFLTEEE